MDVDRAEALAAMTLDAAKLLGITRATLRKRVEKFGIQRELNIK